MDAQLFAFMARVGFVLTKLNQAKESDRSSGMGRMYVYCVNIWIQDVGDIYVVLATKQDRKNLQFPDVFDGIKQWAEG